MSLILLFDALGLLGAMLLLWLITKRTGSLVTLAHLFSLVWGPCILAAQVFQTSSGSIALGVLAVLFGAWWALLTGFLLVVRRPPATTSTTPIGKRRTTALIVILLGLQATVVIYEFPDISFAELPTRALVLALRDNALQQNENPDLTDRNKVPWYLEIFRNSYFMYLPLAVLLRRRNWLSRRMLCILVGAAAVLALTRMTRAPFLAVLVTTWTSWVVVYRPRALRAWAVAAGAAIAFGVVFLAVQSILQSRTERDTEGAVGLVRDYYGGSMQAFESILDGTYPREDGYYYSADMFYYVLKKLDFVESYPSLVRPYAPNGSNIYTFLDAYALDGGIFGALLGAALLGAACGWLFNMASRRHSPLLVISYAWVAYSIVMAVANNNFISITPVLTIGLAFVVHLFAVRGRAYGTLSLPGARAKPSIVIAAARVLNSAPDR